MKKCILVASLAVFAIGFFLFAGATIRGQSYAQEMKGDATCWCCVKGEVQEMKMAECREKGGKCFRVKDEAMKRCTQGRCWCCFVKAMGRPGLVKQTSESFCNEKGGRCYRTESEAESYCR